MATFDHYKQVIPEGFYSVVFEHTTLGAPDVQLCTIGFGGAGYVTTVADVEAMGDAWAENIMPGIADTVTFERVIFNDAEGAVWEFPYGLAGSDAADTMAVNCAILVEKRTVASGRRNRGRMYLVGAQETNVDQAGHVDATYRSGLQDNVDAFFLAANAIDVDADLVILHSKRWNNSVPGVVDPDDEPPDPGDAPAPTVIAALTVGGTIGTQRRRLR